MKLGQQYITLTPSKQLLALVGKHQWVPPQFPNLHHLLDLPTPLPMPRTNPQGNRPGGLQKPMAPERSVETLPPKKHRVVSNPLESQGAVIDT